jgi:hypothetical protein
MRILMILAYAGTALLLAVEARRRTGEPRAGPIAGVLFLAATAAGWGRDVNAANFEVFMLPAMVASMMLATRRRWVLAGLALGVATLCKQTALTTLLPLAWIAWRGDDEPEGGRAPVGPRAGRFARLAVGVGVPLAVAALLFGLDDFVHWVFVANGGYLDALDSLGYSLGQGAAQTAIFVAVNLGILGLAVSRWRRWRADADLWLWVLAGVVAVATGLRFFGHYYLQLLPALALLATPALLHASRRVVALVVAVTIVPILVFMVPAFGTEHNRGERTADALAAYARAHTARGDRVLVWGHLPEVYWYADRLPAGPFATTGFLTGMSGGRPAERVGMRYAAPWAWSSFDAALRADPPALVFVLAPAGVRDAQTAPPERFPRFGDYLDAEYDLVDTVRGVDVYQRR